jgi:hypothetical protein
MDCCCLTPTSMLLASSRWFTSNKIYCFHPTSCWGAMQKSKKFISSRLVRCQKMYVPGKYSLFVSVPFLSSMCLVNIVIINSFLLFLSLVLS